MKAIASLLPAALVLLACDAKINVKTTLSELNSSQKLLKAELSVDIPECDKKASGKSKSKKSAGEESSEAPVKERVFETYKGATYKGCFQDPENFTSSMKFEIPLKIAQGKSESFQNDSTLVLAGDQNNWSLVIPSELKNNLNKGEDESSKTNYTLSLDVSNDLGKRISLKGAAAYVNKTPLLGDAFCVQSSEHFEYQLAAIAFDRALQKGSAPLFQITPNGPCE